MSSVGALFPRDSARDYPVIVRGEGIRFWDSDGREYIDADSGAISVNAIGHGVAEVADAMADQARRLAFVQALRFQNEPARALAERLTALAPMPDARALFVQSGSDATESAVKLARHYQLISGHPERHVVVSRRRSYHGNTVAALALSGTPTRKGPYLPLLHSEPLMAEQYCYRCPFELEPSSCALECASDLERVIEEVGPDSVAAVIAEPVVAAAGAGLVPPPRYFARLRELCDRHDILLMVDEVVTGLGRTGRTFGIEHWGVEPDVITMAKGMAGGYAPLAGLLLHGRIAAAFEDGDEAFTHGFTYDAHPVACAAALAVLDVIERDGLVENAARRGERLLERVGALAQRHAAIGDVRGLGLLCGIELVADRSTRRPFDPALGVTRRVCGAAEARGLMLYPGAGGDGVAGDLLLVSPPLTVTDVDVDEIVERLDAALHDVERELAA